MANTTSFDAKLKEALPLYEKIKNEWTRKPPNVAKTEELLNSLKVSFYFFLILLNKFIFSYSEFICRRWILSIRFK
jgi:hypothetical protein